MDSSNSLPVWVNAALKEIDASIDSSSLELLRVQYLGKKSEIVKQLSSLRQLPKSELPAKGKLINESKQALESAIKIKKQALQLALIEKENQEESIDVTLPGRLTHTASLHPITKARQRLVDIFNRLGFSVASGPEIETNHYNFTALNIPEHHPARAMHDTFYFNANCLLRTHTSSVQIRLMEQVSPPIYSIAPGRVYRRDSDPTHTPMFHQLEGLIIDSDSHFSHLRGLLESVLKQFFEEDFRFRFRPSYFPFTEPSAEMDVSCVACRGKGCRICQNTGWVEVLGCGMVHPHVLHQSNIDQTRYAGFAFGMGIDRLTMLRYSIPDLRALFENDHHMLACFSGQGGLR